jgi:hypothetical protein
LLPIRLGILFNYIINNLTSILLSFNFNINCQLSLSVMGKQKAKGKNTAPVADGLEPIDPKIVFYTHSKIR